MKGIQNFALLSVLLTIFSGCIKDDWKEKEKEEKDRIESYIADLQSTGHDVQEIELEEYNESFYYILLNDAGTEKYPVKDDYILINYVGKNLLDDIYETNIESYANDWTNYQNNKSTWDHYLFVPSKIIFGYSIIGFNEGVKRMSEGDSAMLVIPSRLAFNDEEFTSMVYTIKLKKVIPDPELYDSVQVNSFLEKENMDYIENYIADANIYYKKLKSSVAGDAIEIAVDDSLLVKFKGSYLQENSLIPFDSTYNMPDSSVTIPASQIESFNLTGFIDFTSGFESAIDTMRIGTSALVVVPYGNAFGKEGYRHSIGYLVIPKYTSLVYEIEIKGKK